MKLYVKGQKISSIDMENTSGYLFAVNPTTGQAIDWIVDDYLFYNGNKGGIYTGKDLEDFFNYKTIDLYFNYTYDTEDAIKVAESVTSKDFIEQIQNAYQAQDSECTAYVDGYIDVEAGDNCQINPIDYTVKALNEFSFTVKSDESWTITTRNCTVDTDTGSSGETQINVTEVIDSAGSIQITGTNSSLTLTYIWNDWTVELADRVDVTTTRSSIRVNISGTVNGTVTYTVTDAPTWIGLTHSIINNSTDTDIDLSGSLYVQAMSTTTESRDATMYFNVFVGNVLQYAFPIYIQQSAINQVTINWPSQLEYDSDSTSFMFRATATQAVTNWNLEIPSWASSGNPTIQDTQYDCIIYLTANTGSQRSGDLTISADGVTATKTITQNAASSVVIDLNPTEINIDSPSETTGDVNLSVTGTVGSLVNRLTYTSDDWISLDISDIKSTSSGDQVNINGKLHYTCSANTTTDSRTGKITVNYLEDNKIIKSQEVTITQSGISLYVSPSEKTVTSDAGSFNLTIIYTGSQKITKSSNASWLTISENQINYTANTETTSRQGIITITDGTLNKTCTVTQAGLGVSVIVDPTEIQTDYTAGNKSITVTYTGRTEPTITASEWITASLTSVSWTENSQTTSREGQVKFTLNGVEAILTINQTAKEYINLDKDQYTVGYQAGSYNNAYTSNVSVSASSNAEWLSTYVDGNNIAFTVTENTNKTTRTGTITVTGGSVTQKFIVTQSYKEAGKITVSENQKYISAAGGKVTNTFTTEGDVGTISVSSNQSWCTATLSGTTVTASVSAYTGSTNRVAFITISATNASSTGFYITQYKAEQKYIYFESESKSVSQSGGKVTNNLITNGTDTSYSSNTTWATINSDNSVTCKANTGSSRSAIITATNTAGTASYTIYQAGYSSDIPIWKDTIYTETTTGDFIEFHIDKNSEVLYAGKAYRYPDSSNVEIQVNEVCSNYLTVMPFPSFTGDNRYATWKQSFSLITSSGKQADYTFYNDWSYNEDSQPVSKIADYRAPFIVSGPDTYFTINGDKYTVTGTYRKDISDLLCGTEIKVYRNNSLYWTYTVDNTDKNYVIYWANKLGGWDFLPIKGNDLRTDNITTYSYNKLGYDTKYLNVIKPSWKLYSGWIKGNLNDLIGSVDVRLYDIQKERFYTVNITDTQADYKTYKNSGNHLVSYEINCEMANDYLRK